MTSETASERVDSTIQSSAIRSAQATLATDGHSPRIFGPTARQSASATRSHGDGTSGAATRTTASAANAATATDDHANHRPQDSGGTTLTTGAASSRGSATR